MAINFNPEDSIAGISFIAGFRSAGRDVLVKHLVRAARVSGLRVLNSLEGLDKSETEGLLIIEETFGLQRSTRSWLTVPEFYAKLFETNTHALLLVPSLDSLTSRWTTPYSFKTEIGRFTKHPQYIQVKSEMLDSPPESNPDSRALVFRYDIKGGVLESSKHLVLPDLFLGRLGFTDNRTSVLETARWFVLELANSQLK